MTPSPPRLAAWIVGLAASRRDRESVLRDLHEEYDALLRAGATGEQAHCWYWRQTIGSVGPLLAARRGPVGVVRDFLGSEGGMMGDIKLAARMLLKRPGFSLMVVLTLALGIGATSAVFSLVQGVLLTPPPYEDPERVVLVTPQLGDGGYAPDWTPEQWLEWRDDAETFQHLSAYLWSFSFLVSEDGSEPVQGMAVTHDYFETLGLEPLIGRVFDASETGGEGAPGAIILGYDLWMERFDGDPGVLGRPLRMAREDTPPLVIGVMPPDVRFLPSRRAGQEPNYDVDAKVDYWVPANPSRESSAQILQAQAWSVVGRLRAEAGPGAAEEELDGLIARQAAGNPRYEGVEAVVTPVGDALNETGQRILLPLLAAAGLVLLISCGNAAALLLVRGLQKQTELGIRSAMGAGRMSLLRLVTVESLLLALSGGALGIVLAVGVVRAFRTFAGHAIPRLDTVEVGGPVIVFGLACALVATLVAGLYPALRAARAAESGVLKESGARTTASLRERRLLAGVTTAQAALTLTLLVGAGLMIRTMGNLASLESGFDTSGVLTMSVTSMEDDYDDFHQRALQSVSALPGVQRTAFAWGVPLTGNNWPSTIEVEGRVVSGRPEDRISLATRSVTPGYFGLLGQELVDGRDFRSSDDREAPLVAIVNQAFVDRYLDGAEALGRRFTQRTRSFEIVGVVADARVDDLTRRAQPEVYTSLWQNGAFSKHLVVRTAGDAESTAVAVQQALREVSPTVAIENVTTLDRIRADSVATQTFAMQLLVGFAFMASLLTLGGIYGVLSLSVASRRREIAIRTAVGAARNDLLRMVFREGVRVIAVGVVVGVVASVALSRLLGVFLFEVEPTDPVTLLGMAVVFSAVALLACFLPARRAAQVDPMKALQAE